MTLSCPCCRGKRFTPLGTTKDWLVSSPSLEEGRRRLLNTAQSQGITTGAFFRCQGCGYCRVEHLPNEKQLANFYQAYFATPSYQAKADRKLARAKGRLARLKRWAPKGRFLDVGCNLGYAVEAARQLGFQANGIEIDADAVEKANVRFPGCDFHAVTAQNFVDQTKPFDLLYCSEVIEHVQDTGGFKAALNHLVAPGGVLYLTTPQAGHPFTTKPFLARREIRPPEHLHWFSRLSLNLLLARHGFEILHKGLSTKPGLRLAARRLP